MYHAPKEEMQRSKKALSIDTRVAQQQQQQRSAAQNAKQAAGLATLDVLSDIPNDQFLLLLL
jgi:hypothetical protein